MKNTVIIYGSQYGTTKRYAEYLSEMTGIEAVAFKEAKDIDKYDRVIFMGACPPSKSWLSSRSAWLTRMIQRILTTFDIPSKRGFLQISMMKRESSISKAPLITAI